MAIFDETTAQPSLAKAIKDAVAVVVGVAMFVSYIPLTILGASCLD